jgi:hypothetical protein
MVGKFRPTERFSEKEKSMTKYRSFIKVAALAIAVSAALPALADTTVVESGKHHYVFFGDHDIYYAPETKTYFWLDNGRWQSGYNLPEEKRAWVTARGVDIQLDTDRPYERNDYVIAHYGPGVARVPDAGDRYVGGRTLVNGAPPESTTTTTERNVDENGVTTTTTTTTKHRYVYYGDHDIYFAPDTRVYYWQDNGRWVSGTVLPPTYEPYVRSAGVNIELDTERPYERNAYVIAHYKHHHEHDDD